MESATLFSEESNFLTINSELDSFVSQNMYDSVSLNFKVTCKKRIDRPAIHYRRQADGPKTFHINQGTSHFIKRPFSD